MPSHIQRRKGKKGVTWRVRYPTGELNDDGKPIYHSKTFRLKWQAQDYLQTLIDASKSGGAVVESYQDLSSFFAEYLESADIRERTRKDYTAHFDRYVKPKLGKAKLKDISPRRVQNLYNSLKKTLAPRSVRLTHSILHSALDHAVSLRLIRENPSNGLKLPSKQDSEIYYLRGDELAEFMEVVRDDPYAPFLIFLLASGARPGEARALKWPDINFKNGTVKLQRTVSDSRPWTFEQPKTNKGKRTISLPEKTIEMLREHQADQVEQTFKLGSRWQDLGLCFTRKNGEPLDRRNLNRKHLKKLCRAVADKLKLKSEDRERVCACNLYSLRHSHATRLIEDGVNLKTVSERLGHKDVTITLATYIHSTPSMEREATEKIENALYA
jgi:integrase